MIKIVIIKNKYCFKLLQSCKIIKCQLTFKIVFRKKIFVL